MNLVFHFVFSSPTAQMARVKLVIHYDSILYVLLGIQVPPIFTCAFIIIYSKIQDFTLISLEFHLAGFDPVVQPVNILLF